MIAKLLIVDPDITFAIGVKRSLEQTGDYEVMALGTGGGALEHMRGSRYDAVLIDFNISDMELGAFVKALRALNPALVILISPRNGAQIQQLAALKVQGSIPKPYYARQLAPILKQALRANVTTQAAPKVIPKAPPTTVPDEPLPPITRPLPVPSVSADFDAAIATLPALIVEPPVAPDDTFRRHLAAMLPDKPATPAGLRRTLDSVDLSQTAISDEATIADVVSGKPLSDPPAPDDFTPEPAADSIADAPATALNTMQALAADELSMDSMADKLEETTGMPAPGWMRPEPTGEPGFVRKALDDRAPTGPMSPVSQALEAAPGDPIDGPTIDSPAIDGRDNAINSNPGDPIAQVAAALTQLSVGSTARATLLTRGAGLIAAAGNLSSDAAMSAAALIDQAWQGGDNSGSTLVRYLSIPGFGDFLLFSTQTIEEMRLSMFFAADTPMKAIRKQARQLLDALANPAALPTITVDSVDDPVPTVTDSDKLLSDETLLTRPTLPMPPEGLRDAIANSTPLVTVAAPAPVQATYSIVLAPRSGAFKPDILPLVPLWLTERCLELGYQIEGVQSQPAFLQFQLGLPDTQTPAFALKQLLDGTAARATDPDLWQPGYYIAAPARMITQQEIMFFLNYQKAAAN